MVNRTPKRVAKQAAAEPQYNDFFKAMETGESEVKQIEPKGPDASAQLEDLIKRVDALQAENAAFRTYAQPQTPPQPVVVQSQPRHEQEDAFPDPVLDSPGFTKALLARAEALATAKVEALKKSSDEQANSTKAHDDLWSGFLSVEGNEVWEDKPEMVQVAALKVSKKLQAKGVDVSKYMFQNAEQFYKQVQNTLETTFGKPQVDDDDEGNEEGEDEVDRTAGLMGGQTSPVTKTKGAERKPLPDMIGDLVTIQRKGGWF